MDSKKIFYGGISGVVSQSIVWPLEFMKTYKQFPSNSTNIISNTINYTKKNGIWSMYRGMFPVITMAFPRAALRFSIYDYFNKKNNGNMTDLQQFNVGMIGGCTEALLLMTPTEVIKIYSIETKMPMYKTVYEIYRNNGIRGLWAGSSTTTIKQGITQGCTFLTVAKTRNFIKENIPILSPYSGFIGGFIGGSLAVAINNPLDVIKTRQQRLAKSISPLRIINEIIKHDGIKGLYQGAVIRSIRLGLLQAITFFIYDNFNTNCKYGR